LGSRRPITETLILQKTPKREPAGHQAIKYQGFNVLSRATVSSNNGRGWGSRRPLKVRHSRALTLAKHVDHDNRPSFIKQPD
jgi:hypothetical protein